MTKTSDGILFDVPWREFGPFELMWVDGTDDLGTDGPGTDDPGTDDPGTDDPGTDDPGTDDPGADNPGTGGPVADDVPTDRTDAPHTKVLAQTGDDSLVLVIGAALVAICLLAAGIGLLVRSRRRLTA